MAAVCAFCKSRRVIPDKLSQFLAADGGVLSTFLILRQLFPPATRDMLFPDRPTCETTLGLPRMLADEIADDVAHLDPINQVSLLEMRTYLGNMLLRDGDFMTMAHGLEARVPMLDRRLVDFVARVPGRQKMDRRLPKALLLRAMGGSLPRMIYERPKQGFTFPWDVWLRGRLRPRLEECFESRALCESAGLAWPACRDLWQAFLERRPGLSWSRAWGLFVLLDWCRRHGARLS